MIRKSLADANDPVALQAIEKGVEATSTALDAVLLTEDERSTRLMACGMLLGCLYWLIEHRNMDDPDATDAHELIDVLVLKAKANAKLAEAPVQGMTQ